MPTKGNPRRAFRYDDDERWQLFLRLAGEKKASDVLRQFVDHYTRKPGAKLPRRPTPGEVNDAG